MHLPAQWSMLVGLSRSTCGGMEKPLNKHFKRERETHTHSQRIYSWCNQRSHWYSNITGFIAMIVCCWKCCWSLMVNDGSIHFLISVVMIIKQRTACRQHAYQFAACG